MPVILNRLNASHVDDFSNGICVCSIWLVIFQNFFPVPKFWGFGLVSFFSGSYTFTITACTFAFPFIRLRFIGKSLNLPRNIFKLITAHEQLIIQWKCFFQMVNLKRNICSLMLYCVILRRDFLNHPICLFIIPQEMSSFLYLDFFIIYHKKKLHLVRNNNHYMLAWYYFNNFNVIRLIFVKILPNSTIFILYIYLSSTIAITVGLRRKHKVKLQRLIKPFKF